jgi:hypothetical protein
VCEPKNVADVIFEPSVRIQFPKFDEIQDCQSFNSSDSFIKECPATYSSACYKATLGTVSQAYFALHETLHKVHNF